MWNLFKTKPQYLIVALFLFLSLLLPKIWLKDSQMHATGEEGLVLYNPERTLALYRPDWQELATGNTYGGLLKPRIPFLKVASILHGFGIQPVSIQYVFFSFIVFSTLISTFYLGQTIFSKYLDSTFISFVASIYYLFNPFVAVNVWNRFLYTFIFFLPLIPLSLFLFIKGLKTKKSYYLLLFVLASFIFSNSFGSPSAVLVLWMLISLYTATYIAKAKKQAKELGSTLVYFLSTLGLWVLSNLWWLLPTWFSQSTTLNQITPEYNFSVLSSLSKNYRLPYAARLLSSDFLFINQTWGPIYKTIFFQLISWIVPVVVLTTIIKFYKKSEIFYFSILVLVGLFIVKGVSPPGGSIFAWIFKKIYFIQLLRNPFEKMGITLAFSYSFLFGFGIIQILKSLKIKFAWLKGLIVGLILFLVSGVYLWPVWLGKEFGSLERGIAIKVPSYYEEANDWLKEKGDGFRVLALPAEFGDGAIYNWPGEYHGAQPLPFVFEKPLINQTLRVPYFDQVYKTYLDNIEQISLWKLAGLFSANYVVIDRDIAWEKLSLPSPQKFEKIVSTQRNISFVKSFGNLSFYQINTGFLVPRIFVPQNVELVKDVNAMFKELNQEGVSFGQTAFFLENQNDVNGAKTGLFSSLEKNSPVEVMYTRKNPANYDVFVKNAQKPFLLVFHETYHPNWEAKIGGRSLRHFIVDGYANGYLVDMSGSFEIELTFKTLSL